MKLNGQCGQEQSGVHVIKDDIRLCKLSEAGVLMSIFIKKYFKQGTIASCWVHFPWVIVSACRVL